MKLALVLLGLLSAAATAATPADWLTRPAVTGFVVGHEAGDSQQSIREYVPQGETVHNWTRMVTDQRFIDFVELATPQEFAEEMARSLPKGCPGGKASVVTSLKIEGRNAARMRADCPRNPDTGKPEVFWIVLIAGERDMHSRQVAFRRIPTAADTAWAEGVIAATRLCRPGSKAKGC